MIQKRPIASKFVSMELMREHTQRVSDGLTFDCPQMPYRKIHVLREI